MTQFIVMQVIDPATGIAHPAQGFSGGGSVALGVQILGSSGGAPSTLAAASAPAMAALDSSAALLVSHPGQWSLSDVPAAATAAVVSSPGLPGVRQVCTSVTFTLLNDATPQTAPVTVVLRDGASGVGAILWAASLKGDANANGVIAISNLAIVGSFGADMTLETLTAPDANHFATVAMTGFSAS